MPEGGQMTCEKPLQLETGMVRPDSDAHAVSLGTLGRCELSDSRGDLVERKSPLAQAGHFFSDDGNDRGRLSVTRTAVEDQFDVASEGLSDLVGSVQRRLPVAVGARDRQRSRETQQGTSDRARRAADPDRRWIAP